jgi:hypothetical protein
LIKRYTNPCINKTAPQEIDNFTEPENKVITDSAIKYIKKKINQTIIQIKVKVQFMTEDIKNKKLARNDYAISVREFLTRGRKESTYSNCSF